jgi:hypothetical protein
MRSEVTKAVRYKNLAISGTILQEKAQEFAYLYDRKNTI